MPDRRCARAALVAVVAVLATATGGGTAAGADAERGSASLQAEVQQLRRDVERTSAQLADGAQALEAAQSRHQSLVQRQAAATADADGGRAGQQQARSQVRALARQAYTGARTPRLPLVLTNDLGAVADLVFLRRSLDRVGASQGELLQGQALRGVRAEREVVAADALRLRALSEQAAVDARITDLTDRAARLLVDLEATSARLQARLEAEREAARKAAEQRRAAAAAAAAAASAARSAAVAAGGPGGIVDVPLRGAPGGGQGPDVGGSGCLPPSPYGVVNGFLPVSALCPLLQAPGHRLQTDAARAFDALSAARRAATGAPLCVTDSYRSYAEQVDVFRRKPTLAATPGRSQHGFGLAVDLCGGVERFDSEPHAWLKANAPAYGWVHPSWAEPGGSKPEAWHWEYVGAR